MGNNCMENVFANKVRMVSFDNNTFERFFILELKIHSLKELRAHNITLSYQIMHCIRRYHTFSRKYWIEKRLNLLSDETKYELQRNLVLCPHTDHNKLMLMLIVLPEAMELFFSESTQFCIEKMRSIIGPLVCVQITFFLQTIFSSQMAEKRVSLLSS